MDLLDYYKILEVDKDADSDTIKKSYRRLAMLYHPDKNPGDKAAEEKFKEIAEAYNVLGDEEKRKKYDLLGQRPEFDSTTADDTFRDFMDSWSTLRGTFTKNVFREGRGDVWTVKNKDIVLVLFVELKDVYFGNTLKVTYFKDVRCVDCAGTGGKRVTCPSCKGAGKAVSRRGFMTYESMCNSCRGRGTTLKEICKNCNGNGYKSIKRQQNVKIPVGCPENSQIRLQGEGDSIHPGKDGDLYFRIRTKPATTFVRNGIDLISRVKISFIEAILGVNLKIAHISGKKETIIIPPGTQPGETIKMKNLGMPRRNSLVRRNGYGSLHVKVEVDIPKKITKEQREILENLKKVYNHNRP